MKAKKEIITDDKILAAAREYINRKNRVTHPDGKRDSGGRWYPTEDEDCGGDITRNHRSPSRAYPYSYMTAARSAAHVAKLFGVDAKILRRAAKQIDIVDSFVSRATSQ